MNRIFNLLTLIALVSLTTACAARNTADLSGVSPEPSPTCQEPKT